MAMAAARRATARAALGEERPRVDRIVFITTIQRVPRWIAMINNVQYPANMWISRTANTPSNARNEKRSRDISKLVESMTSIAIARQMIVRMLNIRVASRLSVY
jgi:hypothetical protein